MSSVSTILYVVVGVVEGEDEDEGDTFAISKTIRFYSNAIAMPLFITILKKGGGAET